MLRKNLYDTVHMEAEQIEEIVLSGLDCPMPLLKAKLALNRLAPGALLKVHATDSGSRKDFETFSTSRCCITKTKRRKKMLNQSQEPS